MADFLKAFEAIDADFSGEITKQELQDYCRQQNFDDKFTQKWLDLFDADNSGTITVEEYCETLGLTPNDEYIERVETKRVNANPPALSPEEEEQQQQQQEELEELEDVMRDVKILSVDSEMPDQLLRAIVALARDAQRQHSVEKDIAQQIKCGLDQLDARAWHVIVGRFQYGSFCSHEPGRLLHFFLKRFAILAWRTPDY